MGLIDIDTLESAERKQFRNLHRLERSVPLRDGNLFAILQGAVEHPSDRQASQIVTVIKVRDLDLECSSAISLGRRNVFQNGIEERLQIGARNLNRTGGSAGLRVGVKNGKSKLILLRIEIDEEVIDLVQHFLRASIGAINLVDYEDGRQSGFKSFAKHVSGLRQRTLTGVDKQHHSVDHLESALDFTAEVAVPGGIDDIDLHIVIKNRGILGKDSDAALALKLVRVHHTIGDNLVRAKRTTLAKHSVDEGRLAVINVSDDGDVANRRIQEGAFQCFTMPEPVRCSVRA